MNFRKQIMMNLFEQYQSTLGKLIKAEHRRIFSRNERVSDVHLGAASVSMAEIAGHGVLSSGEKNSSVRCQYINFLRQRKRTSETMLHTLRALLPQKLRTSAEVLSEAHFAPDSIAESAGCGVLSSGEKNSSVRCKYMNFLRLRKRTSETALYAMEAGRSMIEMLGVLAIIGVLSVGAIAGYQKAMFKYKLNKHAEAFNILLNNALQIKDQLADGDDNPTYFGNLFKNLNLIPDGFTYRYNSSITDQFNNDIWIYQYKNGTSGMGIKFNPSNEGHAICYNIALTAKENSSNLKKVMIYKYYNDDPFTEEGALFGDSFCGGSKKCLRHLNLEAINNLCNVCDEKACSLYVLWQ